MAEQSFAQFLRESFEALQREWPAILAEMCRVLEPRAALIEVDGEAVGVAFSAGGVRVGRARGAVIEVRTTREAIVGLLDARWSLATAIAEDRLLLRGRVDDLIAFHDGLIVYLHGAVRAPSFPALLRRFRRDAGGREDVRWTS